MKIARLAAYDENGNIICSVTPCSLPNPGSTDHLFDGHTSNEVHELSEENLFDAMIELCALMGVKC